MKLVVGSKRLLLNQTHVFWKSILPQLPLPSIAAALPPQFVFFCAILMIYNDVITNNFSTLALNNERCASKCV